MGYEMKIDNINWQSTCCAWHGDYAEAPTADGGIARLKRGQEVDGVLVMRFNSSNQRVDDDYVLMTAEEVEALLA